MDERILDNLSVLSSEYYGMNKSGTDPGNINFLLSLGLEAWSSKKKI